VRICILRFRRCTRRWLLWGKNPAMQVSFFLQFLLKALAHPLASFSFHGQFNLA
jgi:hypothetical protein